MTVPSLLGLVSSCSKSNLLRLLTSLLIELALTSLAVLLAGLMESSLGSVNLIDGTGPTCPIFRPHFWTISSDQSGTVSP